MQRRLWGDMRNWIVAFVLTGVFIFGTPGFADDFVAARARFEAYQKEAAALEEARLQGNEAAIQQHGTKSEALLNEAREAYEQQGVARESDPGILEGYAAVLGASGDYDLAAKVFERAVEEQPENAALWGKLGRSYLDMGPAGVREALRALLRSVALDAESPAAADSWYSLGRLYQGGSLFDLARESYDAALGCDPAHVAARIGRAVLLVREGAVLEGSGILDDLGAAARPYDAQVRVQLREALADFDAMRRSLPDKVDEHKAYARVLYRAARIPDAILAAHRAVRLRPEDTETRNFIAIMHLQLGNQDLALEAYKESLEIDPNQAQVVETVRQLEAASG